MLTLRLVSILRGIIFLKEASAALGLQSLEGL